MYLCTSDIEDLDAIRTCCVDIANLNEKREIEEYLDDFPKHAAILLLIHDIFDKIDMLKTDIIRRLGPIHRLLIDIKADDIDCQPIQVYQVVTHLIDPLGKKVSEILTHSDWPIDHAFVWHEPIKYAFDSCSIEEHMELRQVLKESNTVNIEHLWWYRLPLQWVSDEWIDEMPDEVA